MKRCAVGTVIGVLAALAVVSVSPATPAAAASITWRLEQPFRYLDVAANTWLRTRFEALREKSGGRTPTILEFENALAEETGGWGWAEQVIGKRRRPWPDRLGQEGCWIVGATCSDYAQPTSHRVILSASGVTGSADAAGLTCRWQVTSLGADSGGDPLQDTARACDQEVTVDIPYPDGARAQLTINDAPVITDIKVVDRFVLGLGDSFASGEGNPDRPVRLHPARAVDYGSQPSKAPGYPARAGQWPDTNDPGFDRSAAQWVHRPCHRSLYSQHLRLALHLALSDPRAQTAVTYAGLACTGAEIRDGLFNKASGRDVLVGDLRVGWSQLSLASQIICGSNRTSVDTSRGYRLNRLRGDSPVLDASTSLKRCPPERAREIDLVLLSIGGNDVGFSGLVASATFKRLLGVDGLFKVSIEGAQKRLSRLENDYRELARALRETLHVSDAARVVLTAYPVMAVDENGAPCRARSPAALGMDVSENFVFNPQIAQASERLVARRLTPAMKRAAAAAGWRFVDGHRQTFAKHGLCAKGGVAADPWRDLGSFPRKRPDPPIVTSLLDQQPFAGASARRSGASARSVRRRLVGRVIPRPGVAWTTASPTTFRPYHPRQRWYRTPNDAFLAANSHFRVEVLGSSALVDENLTLSLWASYAGAFHPTAQGHAAIADAVFAALADHPVRGGSGG
ncbi:MAG: hypothetical protein AAFO79_03335 [Pseudomonadota bacterium]